MFQRLCNAAKLIDQMQTEARSTLLPGEISESTYAADCVSCRQAEIQVDISKRSLSLTAVAFENEGTDSERFNGLSEQFMRGSAIRAAIERLQLLQEVARDLPPNVEVSRPSLEVPPR